MKKSFADSEELSNDRVWDYPTDQWGYSLTMVGSL